MEKIMNRVDLTAWLSGTVVEEVRDTKNVLDLSSVLLTSPAEGGDAAVKAHNAQITSTQLQVAEKIGILRSHIHSSCIDLRCSRWPGPIETCALLVVLNVEETTNLTTEQIHSLCRSSTLQISEKVKKTPKKFKRTIPKGGTLSDSSYQVVSPAGHLEKLVAIEDLNRETETAERHVAMGGSDKNINEVVTQVGASLRMSVLKSDVMLDLVEKVMKV
eukprot:gene27457-34175_t